MSYESLLKQLGIEATPWQEHHIRKVLARYEHTAQDELRERLNLRLKGIDPGQPLNWRGLP